MNHLENLTLMIKASLEAGAEISKIYATDFDINYKDDESPLTLADKSANSVINSYLIDTSIPIISEENKQVDFKTRKKWNTCWIVDPLDGTKEFIKRNGEFTVNIALVENGVPILGVIYVPILKTLYFTDVDGCSSYKVKAVATGVTIDEIFKRATPLVPKNIAKSPIKVVGSRSHLNEATKAYILDLEKENIVNIVSKGSSLKFCMVAEGAAHVYPRFAPTMEWDTAAGQAICEAVGIRVIDITTNQPLAYNKEILLNPFFIVKK